MRKGWWIWPAVVIVVLAIGISYLGSDVFLSPQNRGGSGSELDSGEIVALVDTSICDKDYTKDYEEEHGYWCCKPRYTPAGKLIQDCYYVDNEVGNTVGKDCNNNGEWLRGEWCNEFNYQQGLILDGRLEYKFSCSNCEQEWCDALSTFEPYKNYEGRWGEKCECVLLRDTHWVPGWGEVYGWADFRFCADTKRRECQVTNQMDCSLCPEEYENYGDELDVMSVVLTEDYSSPNLPPCSFAPPTGSECPSPPQVPTNPPIPGESNPNPNLVPECPTPNS